MRSGLRWAKLGTEAGPDGIDAIFVGHVGRTTNTTPRGQQTSVGGSGYATALAGSSVARRRVGLVALVGEDFDLAALQRPNLDVGGVGIQPGKSAWFGIEQFTDGNRSFRSELGVASDVRFDLFPPAYLTAACIHLGTAPPEQQLEWLRFLRDQGCRARVSVDMLEHFVATEPRTARQACDLADLIFANASEFAELYGPASNPKAPVIVKRGSAGADYLVDGMRHQVPAPTVPVLDTTGAGEILAGVFVALTAEGTDKMTALRHGVAAASISVSEFGVDGPLLSQALAAIRRERGPSQIATALSGTRRARVR